MEIQFTPEQEAHLARIARDEGVAPAQLVQEAALRLIEDDSRFCAAMRRENEKANGGLFVARRETPNGLLPEAAAQRNREAPQKRCPLCGYSFKGRGWDGIDAHWRSRHEATMPYERAWPLIRSGRYTFRALR
jgi:hypothetical protein